MSARRFVHLTASLTPVDEPGFYPDGWEIIAPPLVDLLALDDEAFNRRFKNSPIKRIKRRRLVRNACVAAGNWGSETAVPALIPLLADEEPLIRGHAAWALHQIGSTAAHEAVAAAMERENDEAVRRELAAF